MQGIPSILSELRRRNVFRVAAAYLVVGWLLVQVTSVAIPALRMPDWTDTLVFFLLLIGFPVAVLLAWAFEMTPEGMKLTVSVPEDQSIAPKTGRKLDYAIAGGLALLIVVIVWQQLASPGGLTERPLAARSGTDDGASVAVLPFADMSENGDQAYFADGISEEILNVLVRIPDLQVAGRTSSFAFRGQDQDLREIGSALNVSHVLEGSVRRSGTRLRITAQLIRSTDGFHLWSETYDREIADIFDIQDEIAAAVASEMAISLGLESERADATRTDDIEAYELYLRARPLYLDRTADSISRAAALLTAVVARDPEFSPAWSTLAGVYQVNEFYQPNASQQLKALWRQASREAANRAIALNPRDAEAWAYRGEAEAGAWDTIAAFESFDRALELAPNDASVLDRVAQNLNYAGYFAEAEPLARRAVALDPQFAIYHFTLGRAVGGLSDNDRGEPHLAEALRVNPGFMHGYMALIDRRIKTGDLAGAQAVMARMLERVPESALRDEPYRAFVEARTREDLLAVAEASPIDFVGWSLGRWALSIAGETEPMLAEWNAMLDATEPRQFFLFLNAAFPGVRNDPRWKAQIRRTGTLALWRERGFPAQCRPLEGDDFECDAWEGIE
ncbi:tetratricopeptide repeat protein [Hyphobacterium sp.]|uniref:tetratricopeptide repeat protein n=1 Tax=Hyphobacterium sp. TaxID=2004662 RepID=UPI003B5264AC